MVLPTSDHNSYFTELFFVTTTYSMSLLVNNVCFIGTTYSLGFSLSSLTYKLIVIHPAWWLGSDSSDPNLAAAPH